jgi:hypothetical protein
MTPPRPLVLATDSAEPNAAIEEIARWLREREVHGVIAGIPHAESFATAWQRLSGATATIRMRQRLYVLRALKPTKYASGALRKATTDDLELLQRWTDAFNREALSGMPDPELRDRLERRIAAGEMYLWEDREPRAMVASARPTRRGIAINSVYTPDEWRGRGYATSAVATLSEALLAQGREFCVLYTDLENPTSNAIYTRLGYRPVYDSIMMAFNP